MKRPKLKKAMTDLGIKRSLDFCFGRPHVKGVSVAAISERFAGGESLTELEDDYNLFSSEVKNAVRFMLLYPKCDLPSFWTNFDDESE